MTITAIMPIAAGRNYATTFEGRKNNKQSLPDYEPHRSPVKKLAVPIAATVLAMQPMNISADRYDMDFDNENKIEVPVNDGRIVGTSEYDKPSPKYNSCTINYVSTDGNDNNAEELNLVFSKRGSYNRVVKRNGKIERIPSTAHDVYSFRVDTLKEQDVTRVLLNGKKEQYKRYFVSGNGARIKYCMEKQTGEEFNYKRTEQPVSIEIYKDFYDTLTKTMGRAVNYVKEPVTEMEKEVDDMDVLDYIF